MRVPLSWLRSLCDAELGANALADRLTRQGLEVSAILPIAAPCERVVAARFADVVAMPRSNFKRIETDAGGAGRFTVVSAAPNVRAGMLAALALPGAQLPDGRLIGKREYAGQVSEAMICSAAELGLGESSDRLLELFADAPPGTPLAELYGLPDSALEIELTPNRADCFSILGIAREVHAFSGRPLVAPPIPGVTPAGSAAIAIDLETPSACPRYFGRVINGLDTTAATPLWLAERLRRAGLRATHPVVDILNYVMLELGQPLHAFERESIRGSIRVRRAHRGESLELLTGGCADLEEDMLVIADDKAPLALAGIMGGAASAVRPETRSVFLESAWFAPAAIRGRARRLGLATEAAHRYERGVDPELPRRALERASELILAIAGGEPGPVVAAESAAHLPLRAAIRFDPRAVERLAGFATTADEVRRTLERLGFAVELQDGLLAVTSPSFRFDIECEADLVEEVARIEGFERIPAVAPLRRLPSPPTPPGDPDRVASLLVARGFSEAATMSFAARDVEELLAPDAGVPTVLANPLSEHESVLRRSLWTGLVQAAAYNLARQQERLRLFEQGTVFTAGGERRQLALIACGSAAPEQWGVAARGLDFFDLKGLVESLLAAAGIVAASFVASDRRALAPGRRARAEAEGRSLAEFGVLAPALAARLKLPAATVLLELDLEALPLRAVALAKPVPRFPSVRRDLALVLADTIPAAELLRIARRLGGDLLADVRIFDSYSGAAIGEDRRSIGLALIFRDLSRTLTDAEVDGAVSAIMTGLEQELGAHVRS
ncbi:MAG TPA: phenylalanine--tRNA ligase subunit beta [Gammaproteobacteria bacterium]|nr:phenylalanine--tRNA ligase subunit beta [Gammaproteobacteria bacterium]